MAEKKSQKKKKSAGHGSATKNKPAVVETLNSKSAKIYKAVETNMKKLRESKDEKLAVWCDDMAEARKTATEMNERVATGRPKVSQDPDNPQSGGEYPLSKGEKAGAEVVPNSDVKVEKLGDPKKPKPVMNDEKQATKKWKSIYSAREIKPLEGDRLKYHMLQAVRVINAGKPADQVEAAVAATKITLDRMPENQIKAMAKVNLKKVVIDAKDYYGTPEGGWTEEEPTEDQKKAADELRESVAKALKPEAGFDRNTYEAIVWASNERKLKAVFDAYPAKTNNPDDYAGLKATLLVIQASGHAAFDHFDLESVNLAAVRIAVAAQEIKAAEETPEANAGDGEGGNSSFENKARTALANALGVDQDVLEDMDHGGSHDWLNMLGDKVVSFGDTDGTYTVFASDGDAFDAAVKYVEEQITEEPELFSPDFLKSYMAMSTTDARLMSQDLVMHWDDADEEEVRGEAKDRRLGEESDDIESLREQVKDEISDEIEKKLNDDPIGYLVDEQGLYESYEALLESNLVRVWSDDARRAAEDAVGNDGEGHYLSSHDGEMHDLEGGMVYVIN